MNFEKNQYDQNEKKNKRGVITLIVFTLVVSLFGLGVQIGSALG